jgi:hypothetical protein
VIFCDVVVCTIHTLNYGVFAGGSNTPVIILYSIWAIVMCSDVCGWLIMSCSTCMDSYVLMLYGLNCA